MRVNGFVDGVEIEKEDRKELKGERKGRNREKKLTKRGITVVNKRGVDKHFFLCI